MLLHSISLVIALVAYWLLVLLSIIVWARISRHAFDRWLERDEESTAIRAGSIRISTVVAIFIGPPTLLIALWLLWP
jgi:hypothetical protein